FFFKFLICSLSLVTFSVDKSQPQSRLQLAFTLVLTLVAFKFVVNQCLPKISYLTYLDKYVISSLFFLTIICIWHGGVALIENLTKRLNIHVYDHLELYVIIAISIGYFTFNLGFVLMIYAVVSIQLSIFYRYWLLEFLHQPCVSYVRSLLVIIRITNLILRNVY
uniref:Neur_chan_LBD domain-containing protein n=1 Tax=Mesocestoides corti TaxID=53468 RepID=A0A5K3EG01_MESCO